MKKDWERIRKINRGEWLEDQHLKESKRVKWDFVAWLLIVFSVTYFLIRFFIG